MEEKEEISWWGEVIGKGRIDIHKYSHHDWPTVLRSIADAMEENNGKLPEPKTNNDEPESGTN